MRTAAAMAGLIDSESSSKLVLALEPEAACIASEKDSLRLRAGDTFMILDCGGGTVDITLHQAASVNPLRLDELAVPSGGAWGSTYVDAEFVNFVVRLLSPTRQPEEFKQSPNFIEHMENWETLKLEFDPTDERQRSMSFIHLLEHVDDMKMNDMVEEYNSTFGANLRVRGKSTVVFPHSQMEAFFNPVIEPIIQHVSGLLDTHEIKYVFLVGGFGECKLLQQRVRTEFETGTCKVVVPMRPGLAVVQGAVIYGLSSAAFVSRKARFTYGVNTICGLNEFTPAASFPHILAHAREGSTFTDDSGETLVRNIFSKMLSCGSTITCDEKVTRKGFFAINPNQRSVRLDLYSSTAPASSRLNDMLVIDQGMSKIGCVTIPVNGREDTVDVSLQFGTTEIRVEAVNTTTETTVDAKLDYGFNVI